jgi:lipoprotein-releasing system ATP-binding protein
MNRAEFILQVKGLYKHFGSGKRRVDVLRGIDLTLEGQESVAVVGASGVGKSTLLHILGTLERPSDGEVTYGGVNVFDFHEQQLAAYRNRTIGFVFQFHHLLSEFTALENCASCRRAIWRRAATGCGSEGTGVESESASC